MPDFQETSLKTVYAGDRTSCRRLDADYAHRALWVVGDGGFEPPTSTMSTWRSTPELIALFKSSAFVAGHGPVSCNPGQQAADTTHFLSSPS